MENEFRTQTDLVKFALRDLVCDEIQSRGDEHATFVVSALMEVSAEVGVSFLGPIETIHMLETTGYVVRTWIVGQDASAT